MTEKSEGKRYRGKEGEISDPTQAIDALIGYEEQTARKKKEQKERKQKQGTGLL